MERMHHQEVDDKHDIRRSSPNLLISILLPDGLGLIQMVMSRRLLFIGGNLRWGGQGRTWRKVNLGKLLSQLTLPSSLKHRPSPWRSTEMIESIHLTFHGSVLPSAILDFYSMGSDLFPPADGLYLWGLTSTPSHGHNYSDHLEGQLYPRPNVELSMSRAADSLPLTWCYHAAWTG